MNEVNPKLVCVCEHLLALPELPCFKAINDPVCPLDTGIIYLCVSCEEERSATGNMDVLLERLKLICASHCDAMTVTHTVDARTK
jgi:hypothetical protein